MINSSSLRSTLIVLGGLFLAAESARGGFMVNVTAPVDGVDRPIGTIDIDLNSTTFAMNAKFSFSDGMGILDYCYDFRWFQIITETTRDLTIPAIKYRDAMGNFTISPKVPFVDPPPGGYQYEQPKGDDYDPFYESTKPGYYGESYADTHVENVSSSIFDQPGVPNGTSIFFQTYLALTSPCWDSTVFDVVAGFYWEVRRDADGNPTTLVGNVTNLGTLASQLPTLQLALKNTGFDGTLARAWGADTGRDLDTDCCPEPSTLALAGMAILVLGVRRMPRRGAPAADRVAA